MLNRYKVDVTALQEMKWFGSGVCEIGVSVVLAAGRPVPGDGVVKKRGEGVPARSKPLPGSEGTAQRSLLQLLAQSTCIFVSRVGFFQHCRI